MSSTKWLTNCYTIHQSCEGNASWENVCVDNMSSLDTRRVFLGMTINVFDVAQLFFHGNFTSNSRLQNCFMAIEESRRFMYYT